MSGDVPLFCITRKYPVGSPPLVTCELFSQSKDSAYSALVADRDVFESEVVINCEWPSVGRKIKIETSIDRKTVINKIMKPILAALWILL